MIVRMNEADILAIHAIAEGRRAANLEKPHIYGAFPGLLPQRVAEPAAAMCEWAVAKLIGAPQLPEMWVKNEFPANKSAADVGPLEVRWVRKPFNRPYFYVKDRGRWIVGCHVDPYGDLKNVDVLGAFFVTDRAVNYLKTQTDVDAMQIPEPYFLPMDDELVETLKKAYREAPGEAPTVEAG